MSVQYWLICAAQSRGWAAGRRSRESQRGDGEDRVAEPDRELDDDGSHHVREDLAVHDVHRPLATQAGRLHVVEVGLDEHGRANRPRHDRREDQADDEGDHPRRRLADGGDDEDRRHDERQRQDCVDEPADDVVDDAAEVAGDQPQHRPEHDAEQRRGRSDQEHVPRAGEHAGEDVAAVRVGAERVAPGRRLARREVVVEDRVVRRDEPGEQRAEDPEDDHDRADRSTRRRSQQQPEPLGPRSARLRALRARQRRRIRRHVPGVA